MCHSVCLLAFYLLKQISSGKKKAQHFDVSEMFETVKRTAKEISKEAEKGNDSSIQVIMYYFVIHCADHSTDHLSDT